MASGYDVRSAPSVAHVGRCALACGAAAARDSFSCVVGKGDTSRNERGRIAITVSGAVQGVGFRPFVHGLAHHFGLSGFVKNRTGGVLIEVEGESSQLDRFVAQLTESPPPLARIDGI